MRVNEATLEGGLKKEILITKNSTSRDFREIKLSQGVQGGGGRYRRIEYLITKTECAHFENQISFKNKNKKNKGKDLTLLKYRVA